MIFSSVMIIGLAYQLSELMVDQHHIFPSTPNDQYSHKLSTDSNT